MCDTKFDPEDPATWERAARELEQVELKRGADVFSAYPAVKLAAKAVAMMIVALPILGVAILLYERFMK